MLNPRPWVNEHDIGSPSWFLLLVNVDDDEGFVALDSEPIAFVMYNAPLFANVYFPDDRIDVKWRNRCCNARTE